MSAESPGELEEIQEWECLEFLERHDLGRGWSIVVQGVAVDATDSFDDVSWAAHAAAPWPLAPGMKPFRIAIEPTKITGRRFRRRA